MRHPTFLRAASALLLGFGFVACPPAFGQELVSESALGRLGFVPYWKARVPYQGGDTTLAAYLLEGTLYITTRMGELHAVNAATGVPIWARKVTEVGRTLRRPSHLTTEDGRAAVLVTHAEGADVYEYATGEMLAEVRDLWPMGSPAVGNALMLYVGSSDGHLYAVRWYDPVHHTPVRLWRALGGGPITTAPILDGEALYFTSQVGRVFCCTADRYKRLMWSYSTEASLEAELALDELGVYVAGLDRSLYSLDRENGSLRWRHRFPGPLRDGPVVSGGAVYQYCSQSGLMALEAETGKPLWEISEALALASRGPDRTCVLMNGDRIAVAESTTGIIVGTVRLERSATVPVNREGAAFYAVTPEGDAACFAPRDIPFLRGEDLGRRGRRGLTTQPATQPAGPAEEDAPPPANSGSDVDWNDPFRSRTDD